MSRLDDIDFQLLSYFVTTTRGGSPIRNAPSSSAVRQQPNNPPGQATFLSPDVLPAPVFPCSPRFLLGSSLSLCPVDTYLFVGFNNKRCAPTDNIERDLIFSRVCPNPAGRIHGAAQSQGKDIERRSLVRSCSHEASSLFTHTMKMQSLGATIKNDDDQRVNDGEAKQTGRLQNGHLLCRETSQGKEEMRTEQRRRKAGF